MQAHQRVGVLQQRKDRCRPATSRILRGGDPRSHQAELANRTRGELLERGRSIRISEPPERHAHHVSHRGVVVRERGPQRGNRVERAEIGQRARGGNPRRGSGIAQRLRNRRSGPGGPRRDERLDRRALVARSTRRDKSLEPSNSRCFCRRPRAPHQLQGPQCRPALHAPEFPCAVRSPASARAMIAAVRMRGSALADKSSRNDLAITFSGNRSSCALAPSHCSCTSSAARTAARRSTPQSPG